MKTPNILCFSMLLLILPLMGCKNGPFAKNNAAVAGTAGPQAELQAQIQQLNDQLSKHNGDNVELETQIAGLQQQVKLADEEKQLLRTQLADTAKLLQDAVSAKTETDKRLTALQASQKTYASATLTANSSVASKLNIVEIPGAEVRQDGEVIRIEIPSDRLFDPSLKQLNQAGIGAIDQIAAAIRRHYPRQIVGIEAHTDSQSLAGTGLTTHQVTATQAIVVLHQLVQGGGLPEKQIFSMGVGSNRPRFSNADPNGQARNRRVEVVIYPETYDTLGR